MDYSGNRSRMSRGNYNRNNSGGASVRSGSCGCSANASARSNPASRSANTSAQNNSASRSGTLTVDTDSRSGRLSVDTRCACAETADCGGTGRAAGYPLGMAYVPDQVFVRLYQPQKALQVGTVFSDLDLPFMMSRCKGGCA